MEDTFSAGLLKFIREERKDFKYFACEGETETWNWPHLRRMLFLTCKMV